MKSIILSLALLLGTLASPAPGQAPQVRNGSQERPRPQAKRRWVRGRYELRRVRVETPPSTQRVWTPPVYRTSRDRRGNSIQVLVKAGHWRLVRLPGKQRWIQRRIWVAGHWIKS